jgi:hypothetical protein
LAVAASAAASADADCAMAAPESIMASALATVASIVNFRDILLSPQGRLAQAQRAIPRPAVIQHLTMCKVKTA